VVLWRHLIYACREGLALWPCAGRVRAGRLWGRCRLGYLAVAVAIAERPDTLVPSCPACLVSAAGHRVRIAVLLLREMHGLWAAVCGGCNLSWALWTPL